MLECSWQDLLLVARLKPLFLRSIPRHRAHALIFAGMFEEYPTVCNVLLIFGVGSAFHHRRQAIFILRMEIFKNGLKEVIARNLVGVGHEFQRGNAAVAIKDYIITTSIFNQKPS